MFAALEALRDTMSGLPGVQSCRIGMEATLTPSDYPMVRIVPSKLDELNVRTTRSCECLIYFGVPLHEFEEGLEAVYRDLLTMETTLLEAARSRPDRFYVRHVETILDEDRVDAYKLMALRVEVRALA